ncbi:hypothetical protein ACI3LZ_004275 [Candidozyma auris]
MLCLSGNSNGCMGVKVKDKVEDNNGFQSHVSALNPEIFTPKHWAIGAIQACGLKLALNLV